jgi:hypothetical protein
MMKMLSKRGMEWRRFSAIVEYHINNYTVPQYGDMPTDQASAWAPEQIRDSMQRYLNRFSSNQRGEEEVLRDMLKMAHYSCMAYFKLLERMEKNAPTDEPKTSPK